MKPDMTLEEIITAGYLERYAMAELSGTEMEQLEKYLDQYPELRQELSYMEKSLETIAMQNQKSPPRLTSETILEAVKDDRVNSTLQSKPGPSWSALLAIGLAAGLAYCIWSLNKLQTDLNQSKRQYSELAMDCETSEKAHKQMAQFVLHQATQQVVINGDSDLQAVVFWNNELQRAQLTHQSMPALSADLDYQLWADVDGEMISLGVLPRRVISPKTLPYLSDITSLNITIEPKGGSEHPTVSRLVGSAKV